MIKKLLKKKDLILLHNNKLNNSHSKKLKFYWTGLYHIKKVINKKKIYILEKLNETQLKHPVYENRFKKFWLRNDSFRIINSNNKDIKMSPLKVEDSVVNKEQIANNENVKN